MSDWRLRARYGFGCARVVLPAAPHAVPARVAGIGAGLLLTAREIRPGCLRPVSRAIVRLAVRSLPVAVALLLLARAVVDPAPEPRVTQPVRLTLLALEPLPTQAPVREERVSPPPPTPRPATPPERVRPAPPRPALPASLAVEPAESPRAAPRVVARRARSPVRRPPRSLAGPRGLTLPAVSLPTPSLAVSPRSLASARPRRAQPDPDAWAPPRLDRPPLPPAPSVAPSPRTTPMRVPRPALAAPAVSPPSALTPPDLPAAVAPAERGPTSGAVLSARALAPVSFTRSAEGFVAGPEIHGVPLGSLASCLSDAREDSLKKRLLTTVKAQKECNSDAGTYRFLQTQNLNAFLMWVERSPRREVLDRCGELEFALACLTGQTGRE